MKNLFFKVKRFGVRRLWVFIFISLLSKVRAYFYRFILSDNSPDGDLSNVLQAVNYVGRGRIVIESSHIGVWPSPKLLTSNTYIEARGNDALVSIGSNTYINNNAVIIADQTSIFIGQRCIIGPCLFAVDSDFHGLSIVNRSNGCYECAPIKIGDDVFVGEGVKILKGVTIGNGSVIGSGSIVTKDVEPFSLYAGVPAKFVKLIEDVD
ncbi:acyltransferase [Endozoicomonas sp. ALB115]|uniref:acyltransferase n=1 Tax=Endozoicomonas sp. ALB115 TaxID=3403074 RepID=UPI003BB551BF